MKINASSAECARMSAQNISESMGLIALKIPGTKQYVSTVASAPMPAPQVALQKNTNTRM